MKEKINYKNPHEVNAECKRVLRIWKKKNQPKIEFAKVSYWDLF